MEQNFSSIFRETSIEFSDFHEFRKSDKSQKYELISFQRSYLSHVSCWCYGSISSLTQNVAVLSSFNGKYFLTLNLLDLGKTSLFSSSSTHVLFEFFALAGIANELTELDEFHKAMVHTLG